MSKTAARMQDGIPEDSFLFRYLDYMCVQETPVAYDLWTGFWLMSNAIGRRSVIDRPRAPVFMNLYVTLIAESGITRKSTSVKYATTLLREAFDDIGFVTAKQSPEGIDTQLHDLSLQHLYSHLAISVSEMVSFLGKSSNSMALPGMLTDLYDCANERDTSTSRIDRGSINNYVTFLTASTPTWLSGAIHPDVVEGGFTSRCIFVHAERRKAAIAFPTAHPIEATLHQQLLDGLHSIRATAQTRPAIPLSESGRASFEKWYRTRAESRDPYQASFESREDAHVLRIAGFLAVNDGSWLIGSLHIRQACRLVAMAKLWGTQIFSGSGFTSRVLDGVQRLRTVLLQSGLNPITRSQITHKLQKVCDAREIGAILDVFHNLEMIQIFEVPVTAGSKRVKLVYRGTQKLAMHSVMEQALDELDPTR